ncbi:Hypothetical protein R9X50_00157000 [Acrodontium crateriforme]|uniref:Uncharacterized protein n=1 Tax=Acrodontium crateriforme TaxID=150365 RepID=A0AAQ3M0Y6_9PEZI|nr:Hypothetical protein R9X50_00157000 [Acrodontium crateriforme]
MPPFVPRTRKRSPSPAPYPPSKRRSTAKPTPRARPTLFEAADASHNSSTRTVEESRKLLHSLNDDDDTSLSEANSDEFEDVFPANKQKTADNDQEEDDEDMDWEDAIQADSSAYATSGFPVDHVEDTIGDVSISVDENNMAYEEQTISAGITKKGPSKRERQARINSHCLHVQALLWHNSVRNAWLNDQELQKILTDALSEGVKREVTRWREAMGMLTHEELEAKKRQAAAKNKSRRGREGKSKSLGRDWNYSAQHLEPGVPNLSGGDPLLRLLKVLAAYWRKRFVVTAPGLRKQGYKSLPRLREEIKAWQKNMKDVEEHGERIENKDELRKLAREMEGSRDVGAQLFVALLRGLGLETRMVANLQPVGFGWSKSEEADPKKQRKKAGETEIRPEINNTPKLSAPQSNSDETVLTPAPRRTAHINRNETINLEDSDSSLESVPTDREVIRIDDDDDDESVVDITPSKPKRKQAKPFDRDLAFPNYWIEVCSSVSNKYIPVDPMVLSTIGSQDELVQTFEPRGSKAEKARQVMCYTIAFSSDGSAKDVTVRYLKRHQLPGKTKGMRMPVEKVPVYTRKGKVKKYETYDWFRTVISLYDRPNHKRTAADDLEEQTDLKPFKPANEAKEVEKESLQFYKQSADFALEIHLRREEAIIPGAEPVKTFIAGKGDKAKEHPVYRRSDIVTCKTVESWHKEGRELKPGEQAMKLVPVRAVTLVRKREIEDAQRETGEKLKQGLYSRDQTDWIIPPPIQDGVIPKNAFGNMDVYVPTMVPQGAVHLPLKGSAKICRKLDIDYAEACTGFEFGNQRAVPVITGVVVAEEHEILVRDAWKAYKAEEKRKEDTKRRELSLKTWRKMVLGLRVIQRMQDEYQISGEQGDEVNPFVARAKNRGSPMADVNGLGAGGFFPPGYEEEEAPQAANSTYQRQTDEINGDNDDNTEGGGFLVNEDEVDENVAPDSGGFLVGEDGEEAADLPLSNSHARSIAPVSLQAMHKTRNSSVTKDSDDATDLSDELSADQDSASKPIAKRGSKTTRRAPSTRAKPKSTQRKKVTPRKSHYFDREDDDGSDDINPSEDNPNSDGDSDGDEEVIQPRRTTARTWTKR